MTDQVYKPTTKKEMKSAFPFQALDKRETEPDIHWFIKVNRKLQACTRTQTSILGPLGLIFVATTPDVYATMTNWPYPLPFEAPPAAPVLRENQTVHEREEAKIQWHCHVREWQNVRAMNELLTDMLLEALPDCFTDQEHS